MLDDGGDYDDVNDVNDDDNDDKDDDGEARINVPEWERLAVLGRGLSSKAFLSLAQDWLAGHLQIVSLKPPFKSVYFYWIHSKDVT